MRPGSGWGNYSGGVAGQPRLAGMKGVANLRNDVQRRPAGLA